MFFNLIKTYMRPLDGTEHDYIIHAYLTLRKMMISDHYR